MTVDTSLEVPDRSGRFYQHGWHSWSVAGWRPRHANVHYPSVPEHRVQATDPMHLDDPLPGGSGVGAFELENGEVSLLGSLGVDSWVSAESSQLLGTGTGPWHCARGPEAEVFTSYADALAPHLGRRVAPAGTVWCSWYSLYRDVAEAEMLKLIGSLDDLAFDIIQVDDGWQRTVGDWQSNRSFPSGMASLAAQVNQTGRTAGLWLAPCIANASSELVATHPEMLLRDADGGLVVAARNWGEPAFALDVTRRDVLEWLAELTATVVGWGYRYLKLDFLYAAALPGNHCVPSGREAAYRRAIQTIRAAAGEEVYLLGCGAPVIPSIGVFDGIRVGPDVAPYWDNLDRTVHLRDRAGPGAADAIATSVSRYWLKQLINIDPDVAFFTSRGVLLAPEQRRLLVDLAQVCEVRATSDLPAALNAAERSALENFLAVQPAVTQLGRSEFLLGDRRVNFAEVLENRPW